MAQGGSIENVKYDTGTGKFFIADNDDIPSGSIVQGKVDPVTGGIDSYAGDVWLGKTFFAGTTYESALAAINAAYANGGGVVNFPAGLIDLRGHPEGLPVRSGVSYVGAPARMLYYNITDDGSVDVDRQTGTVLLCDGGLGFSANTDDLPSKLSDMDFANACVNNVQLRGFCIIGADYGVKIGGKYNGGPIYSLIENIVTKDCGWGVWIENMIQSEIRNIVTISSNTGGQMYRVSEGGCGNGIWGKLLNTAKYHGGKTRGICFHGTDSVMGFGMLNANLVQSNRFNNSPTITQTAVMSSGSANITVTDGTEFPVDMPCKISAAANGFSGDHTYFVVSNNGNTIQLADKVNGAAISATGASAVSVINKGFAPIEFVAYNAGAGFGGASVRGVDSESGGIVGTILQGFGGFFEKISTTDDIDFSVCYRTCGSVTSILTGGAHKLDVDSNSAVYLQVYGDVGSVYGTPPMGLYTDGSNSVTLRLFSASASKFGIKGQYKNGLQMQLGAAMRFTSPVLFLSGWSLTFNDSTNTYQYTGTTAGSVTIPTITDDHIGYPLTIINPTAYALTVNFAAGQLANNKAGVSAVTLSANQSVTLLAAKSGSTYFWAVQSGTVTI